MQRHALITIAFAALFGLRAPLCAIACSETGEAGGVAMAEVPADERSPCHGEPPERQDSPDSGEHICDCDRIQLVVSKSDVKKAYDPEVSLAPPLVVTSFALPEASRLPSGSWRRHESLPPPDILLLKATLLL